MNEIRIQWKNFNYSVKELIESNLEFYIDGDAKEIVITGLLELGLFDDEDEEILNVYDFSLQGYNEL